MGITITDLSNIILDTEDSVSAIAYKCTNCHKLSESKFEADKCCEGQNE